ncbi:putative tnpC protein [Mycobacterium xenopi 3993]|nr:putative tnpC protein [Mycobacterium xenopi 3993]
MHSSYTFTTGSAVFDEQNLLSAAGLVPVLELAEQTGLSELINERVDLPSTRVKSGAVNPAGKLTSIVAGMMCGADSIDDANVLRAGGTPRVFNEVYAPSTLGIFLREFTFGHTKQLAAVAREHLIALAARTPLLAGADERMFLDIDSLLRRSTATPSRAPPSVMPRSPAARCCGWACPHRSPPSPRRPPRR